MKNFNFPAMCRRIILAILMFNIGFLAISFTPITIVPTDETYYITKSKITIFGKTGGEGWEVEIGAFDCRGIFTAQQGVLESISGFCFKLPAYQILKGIGQKDTTLSRSVQKSPPTEISFVQNSIMILSTMKMVHIIYDVKVSANTCTVPMQLQYVSDGSGQIRIKGKQVVLLSELGMRRDQVGSDAKINELTIEIEFTVAKKQTNQLK